MEKKKDRKSVLQRRKNPNFHSRWFLIILVVVGGALLLGIRPVQRTAGKVALKFFEPNVFHRLLVFAPHEMMKRLGRVD